MTSISITLGHIKAKCTWIVLNYYVQYYNFNIQMLNRISNGIVVYSIVYIRHKTIKWYKSGSNKMLRL